MLKHKNDTVFQLFFCYWLTSNFNKRFKTNLQERLDFAPELNLPLGHALGDLPWVPVDARDESVSEGFVARPVVVRLHDHGLPASVSARQDQDDLARFHNLTHFEGKCFLKISNL
jgi:hypothetical protein